MFRKLAPLLLAPIFFAVGCKKESGSVATETTVPETQRTKAIEDLFIIGKNVAQLSSDADFGQTVYLEVAKRFDGDENVLVQTLLDNPASMRNARISNDERQVLRQTVDKLQSSTTEKKHYPQIYIPYFEELQNRKKGNDGSVSHRNSDEEPIVYVFWDGKETTNNQYPGYVMDAKGELVKLPYSLSEEYVQQHEVWVLSFNERMDDKVAEEPTPPSARISGYREHVYQVQTDNLGYIEGWPAGDVELHLSCASPSFKLFEGRIPTVGRSSMKDGKWATVNFFIFYWYTANHGTMIGLDWTEKDDGGDNDQTISYTIPSNNGLPAVTYSYKISNNDEHCVYQVVQFDDPSAPLQTPTVYGNQYLHWKMTNVQ